MPITASLGALTYIKLSEGDDWRSWGLYVTGNNGNFVCTSFDSSQSNINEIYLQGYYQSATNRDNATIIKINQSNTVAPNLAWTRQWASNSSTYDYGITQIFDSTNNRLIMTNQARYDSGATADRQQLNITLSANNTVGTQYYAIETDTSNSAVNPQRIPSDIDVYANGEYIITGGARTIFANGIQKNFNFLSKYVANSATRIDRGIGYNINQNNTAQASFIEINNSGNIILGLSTFSNATNQLTNILEISSANISNINWQKTFQYANGANLNSIRAMTTDGSNIYCFIDPSGVTNPNFIVKLDSTGNILWQKTFANAQTGIGQLYYNNNNLYCLGSIPTIGPPNVRSQLMSVDSTNGNINWINYLQANITTLSLANISVEGANLYITGELQNKPFYMKVPSDGTVPGSGTYIFGSANLTYSQRNIPSISNSNIVVANGNMVSYQQLSTYIVSNLSSNTSNYITFVPYRLVQ